MKFMYFRRPTVFLESFWRKICAGFAILWCGNLGADWSQFQYDIWSPLYQLLDMKSLYFWKTVDFKIENRYRALFTSYHLISIVTGLILSGPDTGYRVSYRQFNVVATRDTSKEHIIFQNSEKIYFIELYAYQFKIFCKTGEFVFPLFILWSVCVCVAD